MNVTLINPRGKERGSAIAQKCFAPIGLLYLAAYAQRDKHAVRIIDAAAHNLTDTAIIKKLREARCDIVGIGLFSEIFIPTYALIKRIKAAFPKIILVVGGPHAHAKGQALLAECPEIDYLFKAEAEESFSLFCNKLPGGDISGVPGLLWRQAAFIRENAARTNTTSLDDFLLPARELLAREYEQKKYYIVITRERPVETIVTSRGCPFTCRFCSNTTTAYRARSAENVVAEIHSRYKQGIRLFDVSDANFTFDRERAMRIFELLKKEGLRIRFRFKSRTGSIDRELVASARQAGTYLISLGMESGSQNILDRMAKGTNVKANIDAGRIVLDAGIKLNTGWIIGFPGETDESIRQTISAVTALKPTTANINILVPYPGTAIYEHARQDKTLIGDWNTTASFIPWIKLPWTRSFADLAQRREFMRRAVYGKTYYLLNFCKEIVGNMNLTLGRYMAQEAWLVTKAKLRGIKKPTNSD
ncbi:MAG: radical SAM protein [Candidatus Omnitrophota bacterium]